MELTWNDLPGPPTRWWGQPARAAMRRDCLGAIAVQQRFGGLVRQQIVNERSVSVFDPELLRQVMADHADALVRWQREPEVFSHGLGQSALVAEGVVQRHPDTRKTDLLNRLLVVCDEDSRTALSAQDVFDQCVLRFEAGHETTASALQWWRWLMANQASHPPVQQRAAAETHAGGRASPKPSGGGLRLRLEARQ